MGNCGLYKVSATMAESKAEEQKEMNCVLGNRREELHTDLKNMVNRPESSDVAFKCSDGIQVHACRLLLAGRCAVLNSMFSNGMLESNMSEILLPNITSPVMLAIVEYLYTGAIELHCPLSWKMGFEMIDAAHFLIIPAVEEAAHEFLRAQFDETTQKAVLMEMLSTTLEFEEDWNGKDEILQSLVSYIGPSWGDEDCCRKLSRQAVEYIVSNLGQVCHKGESGFMVVEEYFTLRKIVLWHIYQAMPVVSQEMRAALDEILPGGNALSLWQMMSKLSVDVDAFLSNMPAAMELSSPSATTINSLLGAQAQKDSLELLLNHIDLTLIPAPLLMKVIHPLNIISSQKVFKALLCIAVHRCSTPRFNWRAGPSLEIGSDGQITCASLTSSKSRDTSSMGIASNVLPRFSNVYKWAFEVLEDDADHIELGFVCVPLGQSGGEDRKLKMHLASVPSARILCINRARKTTYVSRQHPVGRHSWDRWERFDAEVKVKSLVKFQLDLHEKTCQVQFGKSFQVVWDCLPDGDYYPAFGFYGCKRARIQLRIAGGFENFSTLG